MRLTYELISNRDNSIKWLSLSLASLIISPLLLLLCYLLKFQSSGGDELFPGIIESLEIIYSIFIKLVLPTSFIMGFWSKLLLPTFRLIPTVSQTLYLLGMIFILISPFGAKQELFQQISVPMIHNIFYILGISSILSAATIMSFFTIISCYLGNTTQIEDKQEYQSSLTSGAIYFLALASFILSYLALRMKIQQYPFDLINYYRLLFWSFSHISWFAFIQMLIYFWQKLYTEAFHKKLDYHRFFAFICLINFLLAFSSLFLYLFYEIDEQEYLWYFSGLISTSSWMIPGLIIISLMLGIIKNRNNHNISQLNFSLWRLIILDSSILVYITIFMASFFSDNLEVVFTGNLIGYYALDIGFIYYSFNLLETYIGSYFKINLLKKLVLSYSLGVIIRTTALVISGQNMFISKISQINLQIEDSPIILLMLVGDLIIILSSLIFGYISIKTTVIKTLQKY